MKYIVANIIGRSLGRVIICLTHKKAVKAGVKLAAHILDDVKEDVVRRELEIDFAYHTKLFDGTLYSVCIGKAE